MRLNNADFLKRLSNILEVNEGKSSVYLTQKRLLSALPINDNQDNMSDLSSNVIEKVPSKIVPNTNTYPVLIRASMNSKHTSEGTIKKKLKISTIVETNNLDIFWDDYSQVIKNNFVGLKKKEKKKSKKAKKA